MKIEIEESWIEGLIAKAEKAKQARNTNPLQEETSTAYLLGYIESAKVFLEDNK